MRPRDCSAVLTPRSAPLSFQATIRRVSSVPLTFPSPCSLFLPSSLPSGMWAISYDEFTQTAFIRHLEWPGFSFFFSNETKDYGAFYVGSGVKNGDILFMI